MKRELANLANAVLTPFGAQISRSGFDIESVMQDIAGMGIDIGTVIDIGASNGRWSVMAMERVPAKRFLAIEPLQEREASLAALRQREARFDYALCVAGEKADDTVELGVGDELDGATVGGSGKTRTVPSHSIDALVASRGLPGPFLLKFDTHGFEVPIINGASNTLAATQYIVMEVYNFRHVPGTLLFHEMCALLDTKGFRCLRLVDPMNRPLDGAFWQMDLVFARHEHPAFRDHVYKRA